MMKWIFATLLAKEVPVASDPINPLAGYVGLERDFDIRRIVNGYIVKCTW